MKENLKSLDQTFIIKSREVQEANKAELSVCVHVFVLPLLTSDRSLTTDRKMRSLLRREGKSGKWRMEKAMSLLLIVIIYLYLDKPLQSTIDKYLSTKI